MEPSALVNDPQALTTLAASKLPGRTLTPPAWTFLTTKRAYAPKYRR